MSLSADVTRVSDERKKKRNIVSRLDLEAWRSSTKIEALLEELFTLREKVCVLEFDSSATLPNRHITRK